MAKEKKNTDPAKKNDSMLKNKYRITVYNDATLEQIGNFRLSGLGALVSGALLVTFLIVTVTMLIAFTGLREFIPGYPDAKTYQQSKDNAILADSLEQLIRQWEQYLPNVKLLLSGEAPMPIDNRASLDTHLAQTATGTFILSREDSMLRQEIDEQNIYDPAALSVAVVKPQTLENLFLTPPVQGTVSDSFNLKTDHLAIDIVAAPHAPVMSILDGTVVMADWVAETGYVIQIQHDYDIISVYKHNEKLLKKRGDRVKAGEAITIVGNSGELTTGPHLHFELWNKGKPVDPLKYLNFN